MTDSLVFPIAERALYLRLGGILYVVLGLGLLVIAKFTGQKFWWFGGLLLFSVGFVVSGYIKQTVVDPMAGFVRSRKGFYFLQSKNRYSFSEFTHVAIKRITKAKQRFSNRPERTYDSVPSTHYEVILIGNRRLRVESSEHYDKAIAWAKQIATMLKIPVVEVEGM